MKSGKDVEAEEEEEEDQEEDPDKPRKRYNSLYIYTYCLFLALGSCQYGYSMTITSFVNANLWEPSTYAYIKMALLPCGVFAGAFLALPFIDHIGRRRFLILANILLMLMIGLQVLAVYATDDRNIKSLIIAVGRFGEGVSDGLFGIFVLLFLKEVAPCEIRGRLCTAHQIMIAVGNLTSFALMVWIIRQDRYTEPLSSVIRAGPPILVGLVQCVLFWTYFVHESPEYIFRNDEIVECEQAIRSIYPDLHQLHKELLELKMSKEYDNYRQVRFKDLFCNAIYRRPFVRACLLMFFQQLTGINMVMFFADKLPEYEDTKFPPSLIIGLVNAGATLVCLVFVDRIGRRPLLIIGGVILSVTLFFSAAMAEYAKYVLYTNILLVIYAFGFGMSYGPVVHIYITEISNGKGLAMVHMLHWVLTFGITTSFDHFCRAGNKVFTLAYSTYATFFGTVTFCGVLFVILALKETKRLYPKEIKYLYTTEEEVRQHSTLLLANETVVSQ